MNLRLKNKFEVFSIIHYLSKMIGRLYLEVDDTANSMAIKSMPFILGVEGFSLTSINLKFSFSAVIISLKFYVYVFFICDIYLSKCVMDG